MLLAGAFGAAMGYDRTGSAVVGILSGMVAGALVAAVQAQMSHRLSADQFVVGLTLNILVLGITSFLYAEWKPSSRIAGAFEVPLLHRVPLVGKALFAQPWPFLLLYLNLIPSLLKLAQVRTHQYHALKAAALCLRVTGV